jgi:hypothetical protein
MAQKRATPPLSSWRDGLSARLLASACLLEGEARAAEYEGKTFQGGGEK